MAFKSGNKTAITDNLNFTTTLNLPTGTIVKKDAKVNLDLSTGYTFSHTIDEYTTTIGITNWPSSGFNRTAEFKLVGNNVTEGYKISSMSYNSGSYIGFGSDVRSISLSHDGNYLFYLFAGASGDPLRRYTLSTPFDLTSWSGSSGGLSGFDQSINLSLATNSRQHCWNDDGTKFFVSDPANGRIRMWTLSSAYDLTTMSFSTNYSLGAWTSDVSPSPSAGRFADNGYKFYFIDGSGSPVTTQIVKLNLTTAYDLSTITSSQTDGVVDFTDHFSGVDEIGVSNDGTKLIKNSKLRDVVEEFTMSTPHDISTLTSTPSATYNLSSVQSGTTEPRSFWITPDGTQMFLAIEDFEIVANGSNQVARFSISGSTGSILNFDSNIYVRSISAGSYIGPDSGDVDVFQLSILDSTAGAYAYQIANNVS